MQFLSDVSNFDDLRLLLGPPPVEALHGWWKWNNVQDLFSHSADEFVQSCASYPADRFAGRGIVICGGGRYFASAYVTIRAIRHAGCDMPIQLWYLGRCAEMNATLKSIVEPWGVECIDADAVRLQQPYRILNGFQLKPYAVVYSRFREVLYLDADSYPLRNPTCIFESAEYRSSGAIFWPDLASTRDWLDWGAFRVTPDDAPPFESGQLAVDKARTWRAVLLTCWFNEHSDFAYHHTYGDKELWHVAFAKLSQRFSVFEKSPRWLDCAYVHSGPDLEPLFLHRCRDKFVLEPTRFYTEQRRKSGHSVMLPLEDLCQNWLGELRSLLS